jgi:predicted DNA-binding protein
MMDMEAYMEPQRKTTILLPDYLHERLTTLAAQQGSSMGGLIREACMQVYGATDRQAALSAVEAFGSLALPVGAVAAMKAEHVAELEPVE